MSAETPAVTAPLIALGSADAAVCADGVCEIPGATAYR